MCKVLIIPHVKKETRENALKFMNAMKPLMSKFNSDGLGISAVDSQGNLFGERWHVNRDSITKTVAEDKASTLLMDISDKRYGIDLGKHNTFGTLNYDDITALTMHTRMATSGRQFENTHPFVYEDQDTSLIHNGVISNTKDFNFKVSSCDSEAILISYLEKKVNENLNNIESMASMLRGYYACGVFSRDNDGNRILDVFKANGANLYGCFIQELDTIVFSTSKEDIETACEYLGFSYGDLYSLKDGFALRFNPLTGETVKKLTFKAIERYEYWTYNKNTQTPKPIIQKEKVLSKSELELYVLPPGIEKLPDNYDVGA